MTRKPPTYISGGSSLTQFNVDLIVNFGIVGGLTEDMSLCKTCIVESVVHYDFDTSEADDCEVGRYLDYESIYIPLDENILDTALTLEPSLKRVICASGDKFIGNPQRKEELHNLFNAHICEMEAAGIALTCNHNNVPCLIIKTVSDSIKGGVHEFKKSLEESADICISITDKMLKSI